MGSIQKSFFKAINDTAYSAFCDFFVEHIEAAGYKLTNEHKDRILDAVKTDSIDSLVLDIEGPCDGAAAVIIDEEAIGVLETELQRYFERMTGDAVLNSVIEQAACTAKQSLDDDWDQIELSRNIEEAAFLEEVDYFWHDAIVCLEKIRYVLLTSSNIGIDDINEQTAGGTFASTPMLQLAIRFNARAFQLLGEIITLVRNGYAEGALARWRSLHELNIVLQFINAHGGDLPERYLAHEVVEVRKAMLEYERNCGALGMLPLKEGEKKSIDDAFQAAIKKYGNSFKNPFGWAAVALNKSNPKITDIERDIGLDYMRSYYRLASHGVHANPKGITFRMSQPPHEKGYIAGPSVYGLYDAISNTAVTAHQFYCVAALQWSSIDALVSIEVVAKLNKELNSVLTDIKSKLEAPENLACEDK